MQTKSFPFPLPRTFTGVPLANGRLGALIWGQGDRLIVTLGRSDWWEHRGGKLWSAEMNYPEIKAALERSDEGAIRAMFAEPDVPGHPKGSTLLPVGRLELFLGQGACLQTATLDMAKGEVVVMWVAADGLAREVVLSVAMDARPVLMMAGAIEDLLVECVPAWRFLGGQLSAWGYQPPELIHQGARVGWVQKTPCDQQGCVLVDQGSSDLTVAVALDIEDSLREAEALLATISAEAFFAGNRAWWDMFWKRVPHIQHPNEVLAFHYYFGIYRFAGLTHPQGVAAGLQGPWLEDDTLPPWSGDYHFNINVQMCYWPAYQAGLWDHLNPLFSMVRSWLPIMRENAKKFVNIDDGYVLPHSVDDRCGLIGSFWAGTIDHACSAWVGKMMYDHWLYTGEIELLREVTYPYLVGVMRVYEQMLELESDGSWRLPVTVSPEYREDKMSAWGQNASFQLAACHWLLEALTEASIVLGHTPRPVWESIRRGLPYVSLVAGPEGPEIGIWDGLLLEESHRHHSHLGAIYPFDNIGLYDEKWTSILWRSHNRWVFRGMGAWTGWCMPWAAILHHRFGNSDAAEMTLELWARLFTNQGHASLHNVNFSGFSVLGANQPGHPPRREVMQMDGAMATVAAVMDGLAHCRRGVLYLFSGVPAQRGACSFENIHVEGGFVISSTRDDRGSVQSLSVYSQRGGMLKVKDPWKGGEDSVIEYHISPACLHKFTRAESGEVSA